MHIFGRTQSGERIETSVASRRSASMPASTHTAFNCAPLKSSVDRANSSKLTSGLTFIFLEWICSSTKETTNVKAKNSRTHFMFTRQGDEMKWYMFGGLPTCKIRALASSVGWGNSILRSNRPDRIRAGSKISALFVAAITWSEGKKPKQFMKM